MVDDIPIEVTILDHEDNIWVPGNPFLRPSNEYVLLLDIRDGLNHLNNIVTQYENELSNLSSSREDYEHTTDQDIGSPKQRSFMTTKIPPEIPRGLVTCAFHWYSVSACQYVRIIGTIANNQDPERPSANEYVDTVIPAVKAFRDKIGAHPVWSMNSRLDNKAERLASVLPQLAIHDNIFMVGILGVIMRSGGQSSDSHSIKPWSLTRIHKKLRERYWPEYDIRANRENVSAI